MDSPGAVKDESKLMAEEEFSDFFSRGEEETVFFGDVRTFFDFDKQPWESGVLVVCLHCVLLLGWFGYSFLGLCARVVLLWVMVRYAYVRLCLLLGLGILDVPTYKTRVISAVAVSELRPLVEAALRYGYRLLAWRDSMFVLLNLGGLLLLALLLHHVAFTSIVYLAGMIAVLLSHRYRRAATGVAVVSS